MDETTISSDYPFESRFVDILGSKMHYIESGEGRPLLFLHGNPTWSYLWRNIIPHLEPLGRCIAPDLIGMGKSDKPNLDYRLFDHAQYVEAFIEKLGLTDITLVLHDWGSALGFLYATRNEGNIRGLAFMEAILRPVEKWEDLHEDVQQLFRAFRTPQKGHDLIVNQNMFVEQVLPGAIVRKLTEEEMERYREPFRDPASRKPLWRWPNEIPIAGEPPDVVKVVEGYGEWLSKTQLPKLLLTCSPGTLVRTAEIQWCRSHLPNLEVVDVGKGIHFLQEDNPHGIGKAIADWYRKIQ